MNDTIYRRDAIQALIDTEEIKGFAYRMLEDRFMEIPSADQQQVDGAALISAMLLGYSYGIKANRPQGEWIYCEDYVGHDGYKCSECGFFVPWCYDVYADCNFIRHYHTCPHCDSRMKGTDDE